MYTVLRKEAKKKLQDYTGECMKCGCLFICDDNDWKKEKGLCPEYFQDYVECPNCGHRIFSLIRISEIRKHDLLKKYGLIEDGEDNIVQ